MLVLDVHHAPGRTRAACLGAAMVGEAASRVRRLGLVARFSIVGASMALLVAGGLGWLIEARVTELMLDQLAARAVDQIELAIRGRVSPLDFEPPYGPEAMDDLASRLTPLRDRVRAEGSGLLRLHVFARDGTVLFSDLAGKRGEVVAPQSSPLLAGALAGSLGRQVSSLSSADNADLRARHDSALEVYVPLVLEGRVVGAYEIYQDLAPIRPIRPLVWSGVAGSFAVLFLSLLGVVRNAAAHIGRQQVERERLLGEAAEAEQRLLRRSEERFRSLVTNASDVIAVLDAEGVMRYLSPAAERVWGYPPAALDGGSAFEMVHTDDLAAARRLLIRALDVPCVNVTTELRLRHADGSWRDFEVVANTRLQEAGRLGIVVTYHDITERKAFERELTRLAFHDSLTGLPNRALFLDRLERALARGDRDQHQVAVLFLDLDNFKVVNDSLGHETGNRLLLVVAERLRTRLRVEDTVARFGGDEFTILLEDVANEDAAVDVAERIAAALREPVALDGQVVFTAASIGIALSTPGRARPETLLRDADLAMYRAKARGKGRCERFEQSMNAGALERLELETDLRGAIARDELRVDYQPIVSLATGRISEVEALVRWAHPERGLIPPAHFIPIAEETGLIGPIGQWVLEHACRRARAWQEQLPSDPPLMLSVNLSARQLRHPGLVEDIARAVRDARLDPSTLKLEITESVIMEDAEATVATLRQLKDLGIHLAIDDFGTGYSSLSYLKRFPVDTLKIDRSFVAGLGHDANDTSIVRSVIALGKALHLTLTAEGIETSEQLSELQALGCDQGQGYYFARPLSGDDLSALLAAPALLRVA